MRVKDDEKLAAIERATYAIAEKDGVTGLTMAAVAKRAGIATGTLYLYFSSKDELINQLYEKAKRAFADGAESRLDADQPIRAQIRRAWQAMLDKRLEDYPRAVFQELMLNSGWMNQANMTLSDEITGRFLAFVRSAQAREILKPVPPQLIASALLSSVRETARLIRAGRLGRSDTDLEQAFNLVWDGIKA